MKSTLFSLAIASLAAFMTATCIAQAQQHNEGAGEKHGGGLHEAPARAGHAQAEPRQKGVAQYGAYHHVAPRGARPMRTQVFVDRRTHGEIRHDPHVIVFNHVGWQPAHHWDHWYRDWGTFWRFDNWTDVQTVTCEAVDTQTEQLFPVTEVRGEWVWSSTLVNNVAARALDECAAETGDPQNCVLVERECWNSVY